MMNERIRELAIEAGYLPDNFGVGHWDMPEFNKFAELIVQECSNFLIDSLDDDFAAEQIKEHFGVE